VNKKHATKFWVLLIWTLLVVSFFASSVDFSAEASNDDWIVYTPLHIINPLAGSATPQGYSPNQIKTAYNLPSSGGAGTTIAVIIAYHCPTIWNDLTTFSRQFNLPLPTNSNFIVHQMGTSTNSQWAKEAALDVEWAHAIAPNATILLVEAKDNSPSSLYAAIDYATSQPSVVAVSLSWGTAEYALEINRDRHFRDKPDITFFAASGDNGSLETSYPASSPYVVSVGGTNLVLNPNNSVKSETAWSKSGGGISPYESIPDYQITYGLNSSKRSTPDVSMVGDPVTGVSIYYDGSWYTIGGTSAGAPQWAAIHALSFSATNSNLYQKAKTAYSNYFRDITVGSNGAYPATAGYDYVTGLGSPLAFNFGTFLDISPTSGPAGAPITLTGTGFTSGSSVNISYLNPLTSIWTPVVSNYPTQNSSFTLNLTAPDLMQNNPAGDNPAACDNIVFRAQDNSKAYNSTTPYNENRRGISQIGAATATGLFGNNTNLARSLFVQNGQALTVTGKYFPPSNVSLWWDDATSLGTTPVDPSGMFTMNIQVPDSPAGQHRLTVNDGSSIFCLNLTRIPNTTDNYTDSWSTQDFTIKLIADYPVVETYYIINNGATSTLTSNGQPLITTESSNNTLEYWSAWNISGSTNMNLTNVYVQGIKLDKTPPSGTVTSSATTSTTTITLTLTAVDATSGLDQMCFSNDDVTWSSWEPYTTSKNWELTSGDGEKTVIAKFMDSSGLIAMAFCTVNLQSIQPSPTATATQFSTVAPTQEPTTTPTTAPTNHPTQNPTAPPYATPDIPDLQVGIVIAAFVALGIALLAIKRRK